MQQELINRIKAKAGVTDETAQAAAEAVIGFLEDKLPDSIAPHVVAVASGKSAGDSVQGAITSKLGGLGGMFGGD